MNDPRKKVVILAISHEHQLLGDPGNTKLEECVTYLSRKFHVWVLMEEWCEDQGPTFAATLAPKLGLKFAKIGTPDDEPFRTCWPQISHPDHDGTLPYDPSAPSMLNEYGPLDAENAREEQMVRGIRKRMEDYTGGLFIVGIAHTHSLHSKLVALGFDVTSYIVA